MIENESILSELNEIFIEFWGIDFENGSVSQGDKLLSDNVGLQPRDSPQLHSANHSYNHWQESSR